METTTDPVERMALQVARLRILYGDDLTVTDDEALHSITDDDRQQARTLLAALVEQPTKMSGWQLVNGTRLQGNTHGGPLIRVSERYIP